MKGRGTLDARCYGCSWKGGFSLLRKVPSLQEFTHDVGETRFVPTQTQIPGETAEDVQLVTPLCCCFLRGGNFGCIRLHRPGMCPILHVACEGAFGVFAVREIRKSRKHIEPPGLGQRCYVLYKETHELWRYSHAPKTLSPSHVWMSQTLNTAIWEYHGTSPRSSRLYRVQGGFILYGTNPW